MNQILNSISIISAFLFGTGLIYICLDYTIGRIKFLNSKFNWNGLQVKDFVFLFVAAFLILNFTHFYQPY